MMMSPAGKRMLVEACAQLHGKIVDAGKTVDNAEIHIQYLTPEENQQSPHFVCRAAAVFHDDTVIMADVRSLH